MLIIKDWGWIINNIEQRKSNILVIKGIYLSKKSEPQSSPGYHHTLDFSWFSVSSVQASHTRLHLSLDIHSVFWELDCACHYLQSLEPNLAHCRFDELVHSIRTSYKIWYNSATKVESP